MASLEQGDPIRFRAILEAVSYTHLRAHETVLDLVCRLLLEKKKKKKKKYTQKNKKKIKELENREVPIDYASATERILGHT